MSLARLASTRCSLSFARLSCAGLSRAATVVPRLQPPHYEHRRSLASKSLFLRRPQSEQYNSSSSSFPSLSSSSSTSFNPGSTSALTPLVLRTHNALHQVALLFPSPNDKWAQRCQEASSHLTFNANAAQVKVKVAFVSLDSSSAARDVLIALLDDPLAASARLRNASSSEEQLQSEIKNLRERPTREFRITHDSEASFNEDCIALPLPWLKETEIIQVTNLEAAEEMLYASDFQILVISPSTLSRLVASSQALQESDKVIDGEIRRLASRCSTQLVIDLSNGNETSGHIPLHWSLAREPLYVNARQAEQAKDALRKALAPGNADVASHWATFQTNYAASTLARLHDLVVSPPLSPEYAAVALELELQGTSQAKTKALAVQTVERVVEDALLEAESRLLRADADVTAAQGLANVLQNQAESTLAELRARVLATPASRTGVPSNAGSTVRLHERAGDRSSAAIATLTDSGAQLERTLSKRLPWWKLGWKVDDVHAEVESAVLASFAKDLEEQLIFEAGRLLSEAEAQSRLAQAALSDLADRAPSFASSLLLNEVAQHSLSSARAALHPRSLSGPIASRRIQLLSSGGPLDALVARAQSVVVSTYLSLFTLGVACTASALAQHPSLHRISLFSFSKTLPSALEPLAMSPATAIGVATLGAATLAWRMQGKWGASKRRFWRDWERLARGLDADLEDAVTHLLREHIVAQPLAASAALRAMVLRRKSDLELQRAILEHAEREFDALHAHPMPPPPPLSPSQQR